MCKCPQCKRIWTNRVECTCYLDFLDDSGSSSDDACSTESYDSDNDDSEPKTKQQKLH